MGFSTSSTRSSFRRLRCQLRRRRNLHPHRPSCPRPCRPSWRHARTSEPLASPSWRPTRLRARRCSAPPAATRASATAHALSARLARTFTLGCVRPARLIARHRSARLATTTARATRRAATATAGRGRRRRRRPE